MQCTEVNEQLEAYIDGDLNAGKCGAIEEHLAACSSCRRELKLAVQIAFRLRSLPLKECPPVVSDRVHAKLRHREGRWFPDPFVLIRRHPLPAWSLSITAVFLSCSAVFLHDAWQGPVAEKPAYTREDVERARRGITLAFGYVNHARNRTRAVLMEENVPGKILQPLKQTLGLHGSHLEKGEKS